MPVTARTYRTRVPQLSDHLVHLLDMLEHRVERGVADERVIASTGLPHLDRLTGGIGAGGWLIRGAPGGGASALVVTFVADLVFRPGRAVVHLVSADLAPYELTLRLVAASVGIRIDRLRSGELMQDDWKHLSLAIRALTTADIRITDARGWCEPEFEMWCVDQRPARGLPPSWLVVDGIDRLSSPGVLSLPRLERLSGRHVVATARDTREDGAPAAVVTTIRVDEHGNRALVVDRPPRDERARRILGLSIHADSLRARDHLPVPGPGQLRLDLDADR